MCAPENSIQFGRVKPRQRQANPKVQHTCGATKLRSDFKAELKVCACPKIQYNSGEWSRGSACRRFRSQLRIQAQSSLLRCGVSLYRNRTLSVRNFASFYGKTASWFFLSLCPVVHHTSCLFTSGIHFFEFRFALLYGKTASWFFLSLCPVAHRTSCLFTSGIHFFKFRFASLYGKTAKKRDI